MDFYYVKVGIIGVSMHFSLHKKKKKPGFHLMTLTSIEICKLRPIY